MVKITKWIRCRNRKHLNHKFKYPNEKNENLYLIHQFVLFRTLLECVLVIFVKYKKINLYRTYKI